MQTPEQRKMSTNDANIQKLCDKRIGFLPIVFERNGHISKRTGNFIQNIAQVGACRKGHNAAYFRKYWESIIANVLMQEKAPFALRKARILRDLHTGKNNLWKVSATILAYIGARLWRGPCLSILKREHDLHE